MNGFTDIHSHILYGIDDGPKTLVEMEAMLDAAQADGIASIFATSHATPGLQPLNPELRRARMEEAQNYCNQRGYDLEILPGAEILYTPAMEQAVRNNGLPALADTGCVLIEFVPDVDYEEMTRAVEIVQQAGHDIIIAHMERYDCLRRQGNARRLKRDYHVFYQVNCHSLFKKGGFWKRRFLDQCFRRRLIDFVASDAHDCVKRPFRMREAYDWLSRKYGQEYANYLTGAWQK